MPVAFPAPLEREEGLPLLDMPLRPTLPTCYFIILGGWQHNRDCEGCNMRRHVHIAPVEHPDSPSEHQVATAGQGWKWGSREHVANLPGSSDQLETVIVVRRGERWGEGGR